VVVQIRERVEVGRLSWSDLHICTF